MPDALSRYRNKVAIAFFWIVVFGWMSTSIVSAAAFQTVRSSEPNAGSSLAPLGRLGSSQHLNLAISLPLRNQAALTEFLHEITDPQSPNYHRYLTPAQFTAQYGPAQKDYDAVIAFAKANGLTVAQQHPNRMILDVAGPVSSVEKALHVKMWTYQHPEEKRQFYAPDGAPTLDLSVPILGISGLSNYALPKPRYKLMKSALVKNTSSPAGSPATPETGATPNSGTGPSGTYMGSDFRNAYVPGVSLNGTGQTVGLLQFDGYTTSDITYYESEAHLTGVPLTNVLLDGFNGAPSGTGGEVEVSLDIEMSMSMAPGLSGIIVYEAGPSGNWYDVLNRMADDNLARQLSCSWYIPGGAEDPVADGIFQQMQAQGQSFFSASGDSDAYTGLIPFPGDTPYITEVGGTFLNTASAGGAYSSETAWNRGDNVGTGGGVSTQYSIPSWQQGIGITANLGSTTMRNTPDVALTADQVDVRADGEDQDVGGTSCAAPLWAGFTALVNEQAIANSGQPVGFINPAIYAIGQGASYPVDFHDTTSGNNYSTSSPSKFPAATGYDLCTGWGTPTSALITALAPPANPVIFSANPLPPSSSGIAYNETLTATGGTPGYTWGITAGSLPLGLNLSVAGVISGSTTATGTANATIRVTDSKGNSSSTAFTLTVYAARTPVITTISPLPLASTAAIYTQPFTAAGGAPPYATWSVISGTLPGGLNLNPSTGLLTGTPTATGTFNFTLQVTDSQNNNSSAPFTMTVGSPPTFTTASTLPSGTRGVVYNTSLGATGGVAPYGFAIISGSLPAGLSMATYGSISGTPISSGTSNFSVMVTGANGLSSIRGFQLTVSPFGALDHFAWGAISSPQGVGTPFSATITAQDAENNTVTSFGSAVNLSNGAVGTILNSPSPAESGNNATWTLGYSFTPNVNITVSAVRSYSGSKVSIWTSSGTLLASQSVSGPVGTWTQTSLATPLKLTAGTIYVVAFLSGGETYYWGTSLPSTFPAGTINAGYYAAGDTFPVNLDSASNHWLFVDLAYTIGSSVPMSPTTTSAFTSGAWSGPITVSQPANGVVINANDGAGHTGNSNTFNIATAAEMTVSPSTGLTSSGGQGGPFTPSSVTYTVTNLGTGSMNWTAAATQPWVTVSNPGGTLSPNGTATIPVSINSSANNLGVGNYPDTVTFTNTTSGYGNTTRPVALTVVPPPPVITSPLAATGQTSQAFSYQIAATNSPTSFNATNLPAGLGVSTTTGLISGTPAAGGVTSTTISATNANGTISATLVITIQQPPAITSAPISSTLNEGISSSFTLAATGYPAPAFSVTAGGLPPGLTLSSSGALSGTPTATGSYSGTIAAGNGVSPAATQSFSLTVVPSSPPAFTDGPPPPATYQKTYSFTYTANGNPSSTFSVTSGSLPPGLTLATTGLFSGTPTATGTYSGIVTAANAINPAATQAFQIVVQQAPSFTNTPLSIPVEINTSYSFSYTIVGYPAPTCSVTTGSLPPGLTLSSSGVISGSPTSLGSYSGTVTAANASGSASQNFTINVVAGLTIGIGLPSTVNEDDPDGQGTVSISAVSSSSTTISLNSTNTGALTVPASVVIPAGQTTVALAYTITDNLTVFGTQTTTVNATAAGWTAASQLVTVTDNKTTANWNMYGNGQTHPGLYRGSLLTGTFTQQWTATFQSGSYALNQVAVDKNTVYVTPIVYFSNSALTALNATTGAQVWQHVYQQNSYPEYYSINPPAVYKGNVYVQQGAGIPQGGGQELSPLLWCFNAATGQTNWSSAFGAQAERYLAPTIYQTVGIWMDGGTYGGLYGFNFNGSEISFTTEPQSDQWTPSYYNGTIYSWVVTDTSGAGTGTFSAVNPANGAGLWSLPEPATNYSYDTSCAVPIDSGIAFLNGSSALTAVNLTTHATAWSITGTFTGTPAVANGKLYVISGSQVEVLNETTGALVSTLSPGGSSLAGQPVVATDSLVVSSANATYLFNLQTGGLVQTIPHGGPVSIAGGVIYIAGSDGTLYAYMAAAPAAPTITSASNTTFTAGQSNSFTVTATGAPAPTYSATGLPSWATLNATSGVLSGIPSSSAGSPFSIVITASNGTSPNATQNFALTVTPPPSAPVITNGPPPSPALGLGYSFAYTATGLPAPTFSASAGTLPPGLMLSAAGVISGMPTAGGIYSGTVTASNGVPPNATQNVTISVFSSALATWESQFFTTLQLANPAIGGPNADPGNDGVPNLLKYLFDINPSTTIGTTDRAALPQVAITNVNSVNYLTLTYRQNGSAGGITVNVQTSPDLVTWTTITPDLNTSTPIQGSTDTTVQVGVKTTSAAKFFIRLNVTAP
jgi:hypothetical protein